MTAALVLSKRVFTQETDAQTRRPFYSTAHFGIQRMELATVCLAWWRAMQ